MGTLGVSIAHMVGRIKTAVWRRPDPALVTAWILGLMFCLPFLSYHHRFPLTTFYGEWIAVLLGMMSTLYLFRRACWEPFLLPRVALVPLLMICVLLLQLLFGLLNFPEQGILASANLLWAMFLVVVAGQIKRNLGLRRTAEVLAWFLVLGATLSSIVALMQASGMGGWFSSVIVSSQGGMAFGNLAQTNHFSNYVSLGIASLLFLFAGRRVPWVVALPAGVLLIYALGLSSSRSAWLYLGMFVVFSGGLWRLSRKDTDARLFVASIAIVPWFVVLQNFKLGVVTTSTERLFENLSGGIEPRLYIWGKAWEIFLKHPFLGAGFDRFAWEHFLAVASSGQMTGVSEMLLFSHAHNLFFHLLAVTGVVGASVVVVGLVQWVWGVRKWQADPAHWWIASVLGVIGIHSLLEFPLWYTYFLGIAAVVFGLGETRLLRLDLLPRSRWILGVVALLGAVSLVNIAWSNMVLEGSVRKPTRLEEKEVDERVQRLLSVHKNSLLAPYVEMAFSQTIRLDREDLDNKLRINDRVVRFAPVAPIIYRQAILLALKGDNEEAAKLFAHAEAAYPGALPQILEALRIKDRELKGLDKWVSEVGATVERREHFLHPAGDVKNPWQDEMKKPKPVPFPVVKLLNGKP